MRGSPDSHRDAKDGDRSAGNLWFWTGIQTFFCFQAWWGYNLSCTYLPKWRENRQKQLPFIKMRLWSHVFLKLNPRWSMEGSRIFSASPITYIDCVNCLQAHQRKSLQEIQLKVASWRLWVTGGWRSLRDLCLTHVKDSLSPLGSLSLSLSSSLHWNGRRSASSSPSFPQAPGPWVWSRTVSGNKA